MGDESGVNPKITPHCKVLLNPEVFIEEDVTSQFHKADLFELAKQFQAVVGGSWALKFHYKVLDRPVNDIDLITNLPMVDVYKLVKHYKYELCSPKSLYGVSSSSSWKSVDFYWRGCRVEVLNPTEGEISIDENPPVCQLGQILCAKLGMVLTGFYSKHQQDIYELLIGEKLVPKGKE